MEQFEKVQKVLEKVWDAFNHMEHELYADYVFDALALINAQQERIRELEAANASWQKFAPFLCAHGLLNETEGV